MNEERMMAGMVRLGRKGRKRLAKPVVMLCHSCGWVGTPLNATMGGWALGDRLIETYACGNPDPEARCAPLNLSHVKPRSLDPDCAVEISLNCRPRWIHRS